MKSLSLLRKSTWLALTLRINLLSPDCHNLDHFQLVPARLILDSHLVLLTNIRPAIHLNRLCIAEEAHNCINAAAYEAAEGAGEVAGPRCHCVHELGSCRGVSIDAAEHDEVCDGSSEGHPACNRVLVRWLDFHPCMQGSSSAAAA